jgi:DNA-directed RNA polymerase subunit N (RpoN/RPB10)
MFHLLHNSYRFLETYKKIMNISGGLSSFFPKIRQLLLYYLLSPGSSISINSNFSFTLKCTPEYFYPFLNPTLINFNDEEEMFEELDLLKICCRSVLPLKTKTKITSNIESHILSSRAADKFRHVKKFAF